MIASCEGIFEVVDNSIVSVRQGDSEFSLWVFRAIHESFLITWMPVA